MWGWTWLDSIVRDFGYAKRILLSNPLFATVAIATLALGIGANTTVFSVTNAVLLRALPVQEPDRVFALRVPLGQPEGASNTGNSDSSFSALVFDRLRSSRNAFSDVIAHVPLGSNKIGVRHGQEPEEANGDMVSGNLFSGLGVRMRCGRPLTLADEKLHAAVVVLSDAYLERSFGERCDAALGQPLYIKGFPFTIVGVAAPGFTGVESIPTDVWIPLQNRREFNAWGNIGDSYYAAPNWWCLPLMVRLAPGVSPRQAEAIANPAFQTAAYEPLGGKPRRGEKPRTLALLPIRGIPDYGASARPLSVLMSMVGLILVIACANVAMLLLARNAARQREFSIRLAIGGSRSRLFRQLLAENLLLAGSGASLAWAFSIAATKALASWADLQMDVTPDRSVLLFTIAISLGAGLVFGLAPLFSAVRVPLGLALKSSSTNASQSQGKLRAGRTVLALQVSLCLVLVVASVLLVRTLRNLERINLGLRTAGLVVFGVNPQLVAHSDQEAVRFYQALLEKMRALPGVESATLMGNRIGSGWSNNTTAVLDGKDPATQVSNASSGMRWNAVGPNFLTTLGVPILRGRDFRDSDSERAPKVAIVNETFVKRFLAGRQALGHQVSYTAKTPYTIVGIAGNSKYTGVREADVPMAYFPYAQVGDIGVMHVEVRTAGDPARFLPVIRRTVAGFSPDLALLQPMTQQAQFESTIAEERLVARLSICFGVLAALLVATGLYGTLAYHVGRRTSEIGIRMALGAGRSNVLWSILRESLVICLAGIGVGLPLTLASAGVLQSLLFGLAPRDPMTICLASLGIAAVCVAAALIPARRAASVDPMRALRYE